MLLDFAPLEGITTAPFRRLHHAFFPGVDRYYTPFLSPSADHTFTPRQLREFLPEQNEGFCVIPQLLGKNAEDLLWAAKELHAMGYEELNLNLGCPSGTVTAKGKGAGMLADPTALNALLDTLYSSIPCRLSVKTRLGMDAPEEFDAILEVYNRYPLSELIIHPRIRKDIYRHPVRPEYFDHALPNCNMPVSWNGSIITVGDFADCAGKYPNLHSIMIGQGLVSDPALAGKIKGGDSCTREQLAEFHRRLLDAYTIQFESRGNAFKRMKDIWFYLTRLFENSEKYGKHILKSKTYEEYDLAVSALFRDLPLRAESAGGW